MAIESKRVLAPIVVAALALLATSGLSAAAEECGDHDSSGTVAATDALLVLKRALGQPVALDCPLCPEPTTTTTTLDALRVFGTTGTEDLCGDDDRNGTITASDALLVLKRAVGHDVTLLCPGCFGEIIVDALHSGFYVQDGRHEPDNYAVGWYGDPNADELRDYFVFTLPPISGTITSAILRLSTAPPGFIQYGSNDPSEVYTLFAVTTDVGALTDGSAALDAFDDLGEGTSYGELVATNAIDELVDVPLNVAGLDYLAASGGQAVFGGAITTLSKGATSEFLFNATGAELTRRLILFVE